MSDIPKHVIPLKGDRFDVEITREDDYSYELLYLLSENGELQIPLWDGNDERWESTGLVILEDRAAIMSREEYDKLSYHFEDDWIVWEEVCCELIWERDGENE